MSELKAPHYGRLRRPQGIRIAYVPAIALHAPHATVLEELVLEGQEVALQLIAMQLGRKAVWAPVGDE